jgi:hypothetical protein
LELYYFFSSSIFSYYSKIILSFCKSINYYRSEMGDILFSSVERYHASRPWGRFLDAGTGESAVAVAVAVVVVVVAAAAVAAAAAAVVAAPYRSDDSTPRLTENGKRRNVIFYKRCDKICRDFSFLMP